MKKRLQLKINSKVAQLVCALLLPVCTLCLVEYYTHVPSDLTIPIFLTNLVGYYICYFLVTFILGRLSIGYMITTLLFGVFGFVNYVVISFRSAPIVPWDIYSLNTAMSVADNYKLSLDEHAIGAIAGLLLILLLSSRFTYKIKKRKVQFAAVLIGIVLFVSFTKGVGTDTVIKAVGLDTTLFTPKVLYRNNGLLTGFLGLTKFLNVEKPNGYSSEAVEKLVENETENTTDTTKEEKMPNIIVIMDEAFSDPAIYGEFETSEDYMPFIHSLTENTIKGECYVSVKGGNTANSEYEFLTGGSMAFLPAGSVPYQQYINSDIPSLARRLLNEGYRTIALHPYNASGWNRDKVYPMLGFQETYFKPDFQNADTLRGYVTDQSAFDKIISLYEEKEEGEKLFVFEVTMQNHGGYSKEYEDFSEEIILTDLPNQTTQVRAAEKYLTLLSRTDEALKNLITYFENEEEDTIIVFFGDHQPSDYITNTFVRLQGLDETAEDTVRDGYIVPYVIWANYDMEETEDQTKTISLNYLSNILIQESGKTFTGFQNYLNKQIREFPVVSANVMVDAEGDRYKTDVGQLEDYQILAYNMLCDKKNKIWEFFE